jgi:UDP-N-acetylglucosamine--dolichyl-phosphate N-acetylglucosaminephosphotransferase
LERLGFVAGFAVALVTTYVLVPWLIPRLKARGIVGRDLNKPNQPEVAEMGGIAAVVGFFAGIAVLLWMETVQEEALLSVSLSAILGAAFVGMMDDLFDLRQRHKALLPFIIALPFAVAVPSGIVLPHVVTVDLGPFMPLAAAFAVTCAANAANMLEGFNGLGTGLGVIMSLSLVILCLIHGRLDGLYILIPLLGGLVAFLWFNKYPATVFPGDTMMLFMGAAIAVAGILSQLHVQTAFIFIPMIAEFLLKLRGRFRGENYASRNANGYLEYHGKVESLTHLVMRRFKVNEHELVVFIWGIQCAVCAVAISVDLLL